MCGGGGWEEEEEECKSTIMSHLDSSPTLEPHGLIKWLVRSGGLSS